MPEYLSPGVYVEETSFRAKSIEGVATSTAGFVGACRFGPTEGTPPLVTSFEEYVRWFGGLEDLVHGGTPAVNQMAHAVQMFFANGGRRVYVARAFEPDPNHGDDGEDGHRARGAEMIPDLEGARAQWRARYPGLYGNSLRVVVEALRSGNLVSGPAGGGRRLAGLRPGDLVEVYLADEARSRGVVAGTTTQGLTAGDLHAVRFAATGEVELLPVAGAQAFDWRNAAANLKVQRVSINVRVATTSDGLTAQAGREDTYQGLSTDPASSLFVGSVLRREDPANGIEPPADGAARVELWLPRRVREGALLDPAGQRLFARDLLVALLNESSQVLANGSDGLPPGAATITGSDASQGMARGLGALGEVEDVAIVAAPGGSSLGDPDARQAVRNALITHCENLRYRFAILSAERNLDLAGIRGVRAVHDSKYAALYYPWLVVRNPFRSNGPGRDTLLLPPDGAMAGIYARSDIERGVHKAPANEVVRNVLRFSQNVNQRQQDVLNPEGINCLRFFEGRGNRVWGARTVSSDPEWTYLNVRRLFIYLEHSIDRGTQWAVFEPNNEELWLKIRLTIESFLYDVWRTGALLGTSPEEAYFVRCDRTTMSQGDLDNGRLVCLIGVAPTKPAEFVIFRIGQWTADASIL